MSNLISLRFLGGKGKIRNQLSILLAGVYGGLIGPTGFETIILDI